MLKRFFPALFSLVLAAPVCAQSPLRVAAAADLEPVLPPILVQFEKNTGIHAEATYQASAMLTTEIENGAPFDLFLSADLSYPKRLIEVDLPIRRISEHARREKSIRHGHISTLHIWWARRLLAARGA